MEPASGMSLPFEPVTLTFNELHYLVPLPPQQADSPNAVDGPSGRELELLKVVIAFFRFQACRDLSSMGHIESARPAVVVGGGEGGVRRIQLWLSLSDGALVPGVE